MAEAEEKHSNIGASSAYRWMNCPGSVRLCAGLPKRPLSEFALVGTAAHMVCELALKTNGDPRDYLGGTVSVEGREIEVTEEMVEGVQIYVDKIRSDQKEFGGDLVVEQSFDLSWLYPGMFGRNDAALLPKGLFEDLRIYDYKNGRKAVAAESNVQCMYYALGALGKENPLMAERVFVHIIQPNSWGKESIERWETQAEDLYRWGQEVLLPAAKRTEDPDAPCVPGSWCFFCEAQGICPAKMREALDLLDDVGVSDLSAPVITLPAPETLSPEVLGRVASFFNSDAFEAWMKAVSAVELDLLKNGTPVPGRKLIEYEYKGNRKWNDAEAAAAILKKYGDEVFALKTPAQVEKVMTSLKVPKSERETILSGLVIREITPKEKVVSEDDSRVVAADRKQSAIDLL